MEVVVTDHHARARTACCRRRRSCTRCCADIPARSCARRRWRTSSPGAAAPGAPRELRAISTWWRSRRSPTSCRWSARTARSCARPARAGGHREARAARADGGRAASIRQVNERSVGFALAPRLNAAGRLYRADAGLELILTEDSARAAQIAAGARQRQPRAPQVERQIRFEAEAQIAELGERPAYVLAGGGLARRA